MTTRLTRHCAAIDVIADAGSNDRLTLWFTGDGWSVDAPDAVQHTDRDYIVRLAIAYREHAWKWGYPATVPYALSVDDGEE